MESGGKTEETVGFPSEGSSMPLKSSLEDALAATTEPVLGLDYVTEKRMQDEESLFECTLCNVISKIDDMEAHILGKRHRLMYMKKVDPQRTAEFVAKKLSKDEKDKEMRACNEFLMAKHGKGIVTVEICDASLSREVQRKDHQESSDKSRKGAPQRKRTNEEEIFSRKKHPRDAFNPVISARKEERFTDRGRYAYGDSYRHQRSYDRRSYTSNKERSLEPLSALSQSKEEMTSDPSKLPADIDVTNEEEAEVVMNVINSLTERFLQYKLNKVAGPSRQVLEKSLKGENLLKSLLTEKAIDKPPSLLGDKIAPLHTSYKERADIVAPVKNKMGKTYQDESRGSTYTHDDYWAEPMQVSSKEGRSNSQHYLSESTEMRSKDTRDQSRYDWNERKDMAAIDSMVQPLYSLDNTRDGVSVNQIDQFPSWSKKERYREDTWNETRDGGSDRSITGHQRKQEWSGSTYGKDTVDWIRDGRSDRVPSWDDKGRYRDVEDTWNDKRDIGYDRSITGQRLKEKWSDRDNAYGKDTMSQSKYEWNQPENTTYYRNVSKPNWELNLEESKNTMDHLKYDTRKSFSSRNDSFYDNPQYDENITRSTASETRRNSNSSSLFTRNWNEQRQSSNIGNTDSFSKTAYHFDKFENIPSLRSIPTSSFSQLQKNWSESGESRAQIWNRAKDMNDRSLGHSADRNSSYGRGSSDSFTSQSNTPSLSQRNFSHSTIADDSFDKYGKKLQAEKSRNSFGSGSSYSSSALTARSQHQFSTTSGFNRAGSFSLVPSISSYLQWK